MKVSTLRKVRQIHQYVGLFFAPLLLLFSVSGAFQTFRLQEAHGPNAPAPPSWMVWMASVHKDQSLPRKEARPIGPPPEQAGGPHRDGPHEGEAGSRLPLKVLVVLFAFGLVTSTLLGITIALNNPVARKSSLIALAAGTILPLCLLYL